MRINAFGEALTNPIKNFLFPEGGMPHGYCYLWDKKLVYAHVIPDLTIFASYTTISIVLAIFVWKARKHIPFHGIFISFALFIVLCGISHLTAAYTVYRPAFWLDAAVKIATAISSVLTAIWLPFTMPIVVKTVKTVKQVNNTEIELARLAVEKKAVARYRSLVHATAQMVWAADTNGNLTPDSLSRWSSVTGLKLEQCAGLGWMDAISEDERVIVQTIWNSGIEGGRSFEANMKVQTADHGVRWVQVRGVPVIDENGDLIEWVGVFNDINAIKVHEQELERALKKAEKANKAKSEFLAVMSHELRTPLTAVTAFAELLKDDVLGELNDGQQDAVHRIERSGKHLISMIDQILHFSAIEEGRVAVNPEVINACKIIDEVYQEMRLLSVERGIEFTRHCEPRGKIFMSTDPQKLRQILTNLVSNAIKFTENGAISITATGQPHHLEIRVSDTGIGIAPENQERIFEKFWQVEQGLTRRAGGAGLGLAITKKFVEFLGGKIYVNSLTRNETDARGATQSGSTFTVILPLNMPSSAE